MQASNCGQSKCGRSGEVMQVFVANRRCSSGQCRVRRCVPDHLQCSVLCVCRGSGRCVCALLCVAVWSYRVCAGSAHCNRRQTALTRQ